MRIARFSLIVNNNTGRYDYVYGFKHREDSDKFVKKYGGVSEDVKVLFFDSYEEADLHMETEKLKLTPEEIEMIKKKREL